MFSNIGWGEIFVIVIIGIIVIGPERLPGVIEDVRAAVFAARKAINNAKAELNGEFSGVSQEFDVLRGPLNTAAEWGRLGPRGAITKALFDGDESSWNSAAPDAQSAAPPEHNAQPGFDYSKIYPPLENQRGHDS